MQNQELISRIIFLVRHSANEIIDFANEIEILANSKIQSSETKNQLISISKSITGESLKLLETFKTTLGTSKREIEEEKIRERQIEPSLYQRWSWSWKKSGLSTILLLFVIIVLFLFPSYIFFASYRHKWKTDRDISQRELARRHLENACNILSLLFEQNYERIDNIQRCKTYILSNKLELAFDELEALGRLNSCSSEFWNELFAAAKKMGTVDRAKKCRSFTKKAK